MGMEGGVAAEAKEKKKTKGVLRRWPLLPHVAAALGLVWGSRHVAAAMGWVMLIAAGFYICAVESRQRRVLRGRIQFYRRQLLMRAPPPRSRTTNEAAEEGGGGAAAYDDDDAARGLSVEAWLNGVVGSCWPAFEAGPLRSLLESKGRELLQRTCGSNILLHKLRLGASPPILLSASLPPPRHHDSLLLDFHLSFVAGEDMAVVLVLQPMGYFPTKLFCDELSIHCKVRIGLNFVSYSPYVSSISFCFLSSPNLDLSIRPLSSNGLALTDLPIIATWLSNSIEMAIEACGLLHPKEFEIDLTQLWGVNHVNVERNIDIDTSENVNPNHNGCYAILEILEGRNLMAKDLTGFSDPYVVVTQEPWALRLKTKTKKQTLNPSWRECFTIPLPPATPDFRYPSLLLRCRDRDLFVDDELGYYELDLNPYRDGKRHELSCKLKDADTGELLVAVTVVDSSSSSSVDLNLSPQLSTRSTHPTLTRCGRLKQRSSRSPSLELDPELDDMNIIDDDDAGTISTTTHQAMLQLQEIIGSFLNTSHPQTHADEGGGGGATSGRPRKRSYVEEATSKAPTPRRSVTAVAMERKRRANSTSNGMAASSMGIGGRRASTSRSMEASMYNNKSSGDSSSRRSTDLSSVRARTIRGGTTPPLYMADKDVGTKGPNGGG